MGVAESLRKAIPWEEFDYQALLDALKDYAHPRDKISDLIGKNVIVRVKKGSTSLVIPIANTLLKRDPGQPDLRPFMHFS